MMMMLAFLAQTRCYFFDSGGPIMPAIQIIR